MALLIRPEAATPVEIQPMRKKFSLKELQGLVGGYIERVEVTDNGKRYDMIVNEEGQLLNLPANLHASIIALRPIVGNAVLLRRSEWS